MICGQQPIHGVRGKLNTFIYFPSRTRLGAETGSEDFDNFFFFFVDLILEAKNKKTHL